MQNYPEIDLSWKEPGVGFKLIFINKNYRPQQELQQELQHESLFSKVLTILLNKTKSRKEISIELGQ